MALSLDRRWQRFIDASYRSPCCGKPVQGMMDLAYDHPDAWPHVSDRKHGGTVTVGQDRLTADFCSVGGRFHLRGLLSLPIQGRDVAFAFGPWAEVSAEAFHAYRAVFGTESKAALPEHPARLANALPGFPGSMALALRIGYHGGSDRSQVSVCPGAPLSEAQLRGISFDQLLDIYSTSGNDLRPHLGEP